MDKRKLILTILYFKIMESKVLLVYKILLISLQNNDN